MSKHDFDLFVIGAGSGGVRAARVAAGHGARVAIAEESRVGGTCAIRGCVPKKLLVYGARFAQQLSAAQRFGWDIGAAKFAWPTLRDHVLAEVARLERSYDEMLAKRAVEVFKERAVLASANSVRLSSGREISAGKILIATGARPVRPALPGQELGITSNEVFHLPQLPERIAIVGGGYIALEFAGVFHALGVKVTLLQRGDAILRGFDAQITERLVQISLHNGIDLRLQTQVESITSNRDGSLRVALQGEPANDADLVLFATGRAPNVAGLRLREVGVALNEREAVQVDADNKSSVDSIYAVGDVTDRVQLTPVAVREGQAFADTCFGTTPVRVDYENIPSAVFSQPPIASVGMTEAQAKQHVTDVRIYTADFRPLKSVFAGSEERALYKMVVDATTDVVLGLHMIGPDVPEILQAAAVAVKAKLTKAAFDATIALHPSMAEELVLMS